MGELELDSVDAHAHLPHRGAEVVTERGGPPATTFSWGALACRVIVLIVWGVTPVCWIYVIWSAIGASLPASIPRPPDTHTSSKKAFLAHSLLLAYAVVECLFSIYYALLVRSLQGRVPLPRYNNAFLRQTLARALEDGMKAEDADSIASHVATERKRSNSVYMMRRRPTFSRADFSRLSFMEVKTKLTAEDPRAVVWREQFCRWFLQTRWQDLKRDNVLEWLAWSLFGEDLGKVMQEWEQEGRPRLPDCMFEIGDIFAETPMDDEPQGKAAFLYHALYMLEARAGMPFPNGKSTTAKSIRLHLDPVRATSRPLIKYLVVGGLNALIRRRTARYGYQYVEDGGLEYLIRMPPDWTPDGTEATRPLIFVHGLGMGIAQYASSISYFEQHPALHARPLILLLQPHLSMAFFHPRHLKPPNKAQTTAGLRALVAKWHFESGVTILSHSNGTIVHAWLLKDCPDLVKRSCFVDPVTFCLWEPSVAYNFLYKPPKRGIEILMRYFVGEEVGIALLLQRYFDWSANILWFEEIPHALDTHSTMFILAEKDSILDANLLARYLRDHGAKYTEDGGNIRFLPGYAHGEALINGGKTMVEIMDWLTHEGDGTKKRTPRPRVGTGYFGLPGAGLSGARSPFSPGAPYSSLMSPLGPLKENGTYNQLSSFSMK